MAKLGSWIGSLSEMHWTTFLVGVVALGVILGLRRMARGPRCARARGGRAAGVISIRPRHTGWRLSATYHAGFRFRAADLALVRDHYATVAIASIALLLIGFSQTAGDARVFASRHRYRIDLDQESVAQGLANVGAGAFQGMPVTTSYPLAR